MRLLFNIAEVAARTKSGHSITIEHALDSALGAAADADLWIYFPDQRHLYEDQ